MIFTNLIKTNLRTKQFGKDIEYYQRLKSTNREAWELIQVDKAKHGMIIITDDQFDGKGRGGNTWFMSPSKGIAMSIILIKKFSLNDALLIPIAAGVAVAKTLSHRGGNPKLKWPNDILLNKKKCGGILCESKISNHIVKKMVIGIGLNINESIADFPKSINKSATSLAIETKHPNQRELVCAIFITYFEQLLDHLDSCIKDWLSYCVHLDKPVSFSYNGSNYCGIFKGINHSGHALIEIDRKEKLFPSILIN